MSMYMPICLYPLFLTYAKMPSLEKNAIVYKGRKNPMKSSKTVLLISR